MGRRREIFGETEDELRGHLEFLCSFRISEWRSPVGSWICESGVQSGLGWGDMDVETVSTEAMIMAKVTQERT